MPKIGIQLYTLRQEVEKDIKVVLRELSSIGYHGVEFAFGYGGMKPGPLSRFLRGEGLECAGIYTNIRKASTPKSGDYAYAEAMDCRYIISGITGMVSGREWPSAVEMACEAADAASLEGRTFLYHNHWQELAMLGGRSALDILFEQTRSRGLCFELDTGWLCKAGLDPVGYIKKFSGRLPCLHVRDYSPDFEVMELGEGIVDIPGAVEAALRSGVDWLVFEQSAGSLESARASFEKLAMLIRGFNGEVSA